MIVARLNSGSIIGYNVPPQSDKMVWEWLNSLSCVKTVWEESVNTFRNRRKDGPGS